MAFPAVPQSDTVLLECKYGMYQPLGGEDEVMMMAA